MNRRRPAAAASAGAVTGCLRARAAAGVEAGAASPGPVMCGRAAPPPGGYVVSNHWVKNWPSRWRQAALRVGSQRPKAASSWASVIDAPPY